MLQRGNADSVAPAASTGNYLKFLSVDAVQIADFLWIKHLPRERPGRHSHAGAWEREKDNLAVQEWVEVLFYGQVAWGAFESCFSNSQIYAIINYCYRFR